MEPSTSAFSDGLSLSANKDGTLTGNANHSESVKTCHGEHCISRDLKDLAATSSLGLGLV